ncbi:hypothetical protein BD408DRAFT_413109, partial [Parasitella parasitica]
RERKESGLATTAEVVCTLLPYYAQVGIPLKPKLLCTVNMVNNTLLCTMCIIDKTAHVLIVKLICALHIICPYA